MSNPLAQLAKVGQSVWYDQMERKLISTGKLQKMIEQDDLRGLTSNPTIFEKAIAGSEDYDTQLRQLASENRSRDEIYEELVVEDIGNAADVFRPVYDKTKGLDGYVSLEVSPLLARNTDATIVEAKKLFGRLGKKNLMIKIPGTPEGLPAIEEAIASGINVNVTLIFNNDQYAAVIDAYMKGLERRVAANQPVGDISSVASFFVSRIDAAAEKLMEAKIAEKNDPQFKKDAESLFAKIAIANAKTAYELFQKSFTSDRFKKLAAKGARVQRPLWASTGTKSAKYSDVMYPEALIGPDTVDTMPPATYEAFRDHGKVRPTLEENFAEAHAVLKKFADLGFSLKALTEKLTEDGVKSFADSFVSLMSVIEARRDAAVRGLSERITFHLSKDQQAAVDTAAQRADKEKFVERVWKKDASLWKQDEAHQKIIKNALGWLPVVEQMQKEAGEIVSFAESVRSEFSHVVVLGMGGSSLCSEVTRRVFGKRPGYPVLEVLDSTVPEAVRALESRIDVGKSLFIVASKSGTTTEPMIFHRYFYDRVKQIKGDKAGENFIAVTDPDTQLGKDATRDKFRKIFINPADIGGRYSALSKFGLVPAAISGVDVKNLLDRAAHATHVAMLPNMKNNPAAMLGVVMGAMANSGRDKITLITPAPLDTLGLWVEQLIAESTGKEGKGILPVAGEPLIDPSHYGKDRLFVMVRMRKAEQNGRVAALVAAGHPVVDMLLEDELDLGENFFVWEFATAVAGAIIGINAFDQPNVQESKDNTRRLLDEFKSAGSINEGAFVKAGDEAAVISLLGKVKPGDYVALTEYFADSPKRDEIIGQIRGLVASNLNVATTTGYGPRFLHSTGQLHKGGGDNGVFIQLTADSDDVTIPGEKYGFSTLARAQSVGDFQSLESRKRRALRIHLGKDVDGGLEWLLSTVKSAMAKS